mgnify:CR=1 FL=1
MQYKTTLFDNIVANWIKHTLLLELKYFLGIENSTEIPLEFMASKNNVI